MDAKSELWGKKVRNAVCLAIVLAVGGTLAPSSWAGGGSHPIARPAAYNPTTVVMFTGSYSDVDTNPNAGGPTASGAQTTASYTQTSEKLTWTATVTGPINNIDLFDRPGLPRSPTLSVTYSVTGTVSASVSPYGAVQGLSSCSGTISAPGPSTNYLLNAEVLGTQKPYSYDVSATPPVPWVYGSTDGELDWSDQNSQDFCDGAQNAPAIWYSLWQAGAAVPQPFAHFLDLHMTKQAENPASVTAKFSEAGRDGEGGRDVLSGQDSLSFVGVSQQVATAILEGRPAPAGSGVSDVLSCTMPFTLSCQATETLTASRSQGAHASHPGKGRAVVVGRRTVRIRGGKRARVVVGLNHTGRQLLKQAGKLVVSLTVSIRQGKKQATVARRNLTLRSASHKH
jgi:hypothetical protein